MYLKRNEQIARREKFLITTEIMEVLPDLSLYTLIFKSPNDEIHMSKNMVFDSSSNTLSAIVEVEAACQQQVVDYQPNLSTVNTIRPA